MRVMSTRSVPFLTPEQYLEIERAKGVRCEYIDGAIFDIAGSTPNHDRIVLSVVSDLSIQLSGTDLAAADTDFRLHVPKSNIFTYPDVVVFRCTPDRFVDSRTHDTLADVIVVVRVLSPEPVNDDHGEKFRYYRSLPSFAEYLVLAQDEVRAEHWARQPDGAWLLRDYFALSDEITLASIGCRLRLHDVYRRLELP